MHKEYFQLYTDIFLNIKLFEVQNKQKRLFKSISRWFPLNTMVLFIVCFHIKIFFKY